MRIRIQFLTNTDPNPAAKKRLIQIRHPAFKFKATACLKPTRTKTKTRLKVRVDGRKNPSIHQSLNFYLFHGDN
jgi:hypothetical protein